MHYLSLIDEGKDAGGFYMRMKGRAHALVVILDDAVELFGLMLGLSLRIYWTTNAITWKQQEIHRVGI